MLHYQDLTRLTGTAAEPGCKKYSHPPPTILLHRPWLIPASDPSLTLVSAKIPPIHHCGGSLNECSGGFNFIFNAVSAGLITQDYKISRMEDQKKRGAACLVAGNQAWTLNKGLNVTMWRRDEALHCNNTMYKGCCHQITRPLCVSCVWSGHYWSELVLWNDPSVSQSLRRPLVVIVKLHRLIVYITSADSVQLTVAWYYPDTVSTSISSP